MTGLMNTRQQKSFNVLLIGDACEDTYTYGTVDRISPEAPVPVFVPRYTITRDGMASNVCKNLENLGCGVNFLFGSTSKKQRLIDERSKQQIVRIDNDALTQEPLEFVTDIPLVYDAIVISDYNKGTVSYNLIKKIRKEFTGPVFLDTKKHDLAQFEGCIIKVNQLEYSQATSKPSRSTPLIVTHGDKGVVWDTYNFGAKPVEVSDVTGAGDTFLAALCYQYLATDDLHKAIPFAIAASAVTVQHVGCYAPSIKEVLG